MPNFMPIGLKLWALEGYRQTNRQSYFNNIDGKSTIEIRARLAIALSAMSRLSKIWKRVKEFQLQQR